ncbi:acyl carrier protein [Frankia sp. CNm7]|uniref:Acyl carrier protein n=1 Tax=Frankia nepalensis TaxID=1836974 RepID=A0A937RU62_9ACTN|nr:acyl carrier protein [Frankia nepalensis]MBL7494879.1 acyl carrier protein [Frankia nepalensis]MBL7514415.1 acyl carrier protein [Frankia nepalensis]MBL7518359.1 acyl carrier protein [Frankia nepalensis]MBL7632873.1 acyl carrier protein [Frankia nepalensis]
MNGEFATSYKEAGMSDPIGPEIEQILRIDLQVDTSRITRGSHLVDEVGLDSVAFAVGMVAIEERFGVMLTEQEMARCETVADLEDVILAKRG